MRTLGWRIATLFAMSLSVFIGALGCGVSPAPAVAAPPHSSLALVPPASFSLEPQHPLDFDTLGIPNFGFVSADVWRGGEPTAEGYLLLANSHVGTIIDLQLGDAQAKIPPGIVYRHFGVSGLQADQVDIAAVLRAIDECPKPIYIHCREGRDRTGLAVAAYRLRQKMPAKEVCEELENFHVNLWWRWTIERRINELAKNGLPS